MENWPTEFISPNSLLLQCQVYVSARPVSTFHLSVPDPEIDSVLFVLPVQHRCFRASEFLVMVVVGVHQQNMCVPFIILLLNNFCSTQILKFSALCKFVVISTNVFGNAC
jgi:hypothetical protein